MTSANAGQGFATGVTPSSRDTPAPGLAVSIAICTHNRFADAEECIRALHPQVDPARGEILLVDSASRSDVAADLRRLAAEYPGVRLLRLDLPGLSTARNAAIADAQGEWVAFLDDDAVPFPDYFSSLLSAIERISPDVAFFGGRLLPRWPADHRPVGGRWSRMLSLIDDARERETELGLIYGANIVYRRSLLQTFAEPFDPSLGRIGDSLKSGEEMKLHIQLHDRGYACRYFGTVGAEHKVAPARLQLTWLRQRAFWEGITLVALLQTLAKPYPRGAHVPWQVLKILALAPKALLHDPERDALIRICQSAGVIRARVFGLI